MHLGGVDVKWMKTLHKILKERIESEKKGKNNEGVGKVTKRRCLPVCKCHSAAQLSGW